LVCDKNPLQHETCAWDHYLVVKVSFYHTIVGQQEERSWACKIFIIHYFCKTNKAANELFDTVRVNGHITTLMFNGAYRIEFSKDSMKGIFGFDVFFLAEEIFVLKLYVYILQKKNRFFC